jgi:hypothetical protein
MKSTKMTLHKDVCMYQRRILLISSISFLKMCGFSYNFGWIQFRIPKRSESGLGKAVLDLEASHSKQILKKR